MQGHHELRTEDRAKVEAWAKRDTRALTLSCVVAFLSGGVTILLLLVLFQICLVPDSHQHFAPDGHHSHIAPP
jgi:hypothetical protein